MGIGVLNDGTDLVVGVCEVGVEGVHEAKDVEQLGIRQVSVRVQQLRAAEDVSICHVTDCQD